MAQAMIITENRNLEIGGFDLVGKSFVIGTRSNDLYVRYIQIQIVIFCFNIKLFFFVFIVVVVHRFRFKYTYATNDS